MIFCVSHCVSVVLCQINWFTTYWHQNHHNYVLQLDSNCLGGCNKNTMKSTAYLEHRTTIKVFSNLGQTLTW